MIYKEHRQSPQGFMLHTNMLLMVVPFLGAYISCPSQEHPEENRKDREVSGWLWNDRKEGGGGVRSMRLWPIHGE